MTDMAPDRDATEPLLEESTDPQGDPTEAKRAICDSDGGIGKCGPANLSSLSQMHGKVMRSLGSRIQQDDIISTIPFGQSSGGFNLVPCKITFTTCRKTYTHYNI